MTEAQEPISDVSFGSCTEGDSRECTIILGIHNDIVSCYKGVQLCVDSLWGDCQDGQIGTLDDLPGVVE